MFITFFYFEIFYICFLTLKLEKLSRVSQLTIHENGNWLHSMNMILWLEWIPTRFSNSLPIFLFYQKVAVPSKVQDILFAALAKMFKWTKKTWNFHFLCSIFPRIQEEYLRYGCADRKESKINYFFFKRLIFLLLSYLQKAFFYIYPIFVANETCSRSSWKAFHPIFLGYVI